MNFCYFTSFKHTTCSRITSTTFIQQPLTPEALYAQINDKTSPVANTDASNSVTDNLITTSVAGSLKENESDSSNDSLEQRPTDAVARTNGNNSDEASGYFTEERINTSAEDVSHLLPPVAMDYLSSSSSSQTDNNSCDDEGNLEPMCGLTHDPINDKANLKLKTPSVTEDQANELDNAIKPGESSLCIYVAIMIYFLSTVVHCNGLHVTLMKCLQKHCTTLNMLNILMILM